MNIQIKYNYINTVLYCLERGYLWVFFEVRVYTEKNDMTFIIVHYNLLTDGFQLQLIKIWLI